MSHIDLPGADRHEAGCPRIGRGSGHHHCRLQARHTGSCSCPCDPCIDRAERLAAY